MNSFFHRVTVMLACTQNGDKLKPYVIFPGTAPSELNDTDDPRTVWRQLNDSQEAGRITNRIVLGVNSKAWMTTRDYYRYLFIHCYFKYQLTS
mmetsp:Transcript_10316/g.12943  ORF Transcript_10316/g.12943 Transcript_10316/m.12943 type:complete len:93 (-) Transcript_10316:10-288(-)